MEKTGMMEVEAKTITETDAIMLAWNDSKENVPLANISDLKECEKSLKKEVEINRSEIRKIGESLKKAINANRSEANEIEHSLKLEIANTKIELIQMINSNSNKIIGILISAQALIGALIGFFKYFT